MTIKPFEKPCFEETLAYTQSNWGLVDRTFDKHEIKKLIYWFASNYGSTGAVIMLEKLKVLGFEQSTKAGISFSIDDLLVPSIKTNLITNATYELDANTCQYNKLTGSISSLERFTRITDVWNTTNDLLKNEVLKNFERINPLNPIYMMTCSGARGNLSQVRQLVGMRGLMADAQGGIIDFPIKSNFREGLTTTEYFISCYGARKGLVDTALRTADAGYLTRRLVETARSVITYTFNCNTNRYILLSALTDIDNPSKIILPISQRIVGRCLAKPIYKLQANQIIGDSNQIGKELNKIAIRSPLTCDAYPFVCRLCYGWDLSTVNLVEEQIAVGIIAAQSIGEPGTQLTMRTFHTGGVFFGGLAQRTYALHSGTMFFLMPNYVVPVRTKFGQRAILLQNDLEIYVLGPLASLSFEEKNEIVNFFYSVFKAEFNFSKSKVKINAFLFGSASSLSFEERSEISSLLYVILCSDQVLTSRRDASFNSSAPSGCPRGSVPGSGLISFNVDTNDSGASRQEKLRETRQHLRASRQFTRSVPEREATPDQLGKKVDNKALCAADQVLTLNVAKLRWSQTHYIKYRKQVSDFLAKFKVSHSKLKVQANNLLFVAPGDKVYLKQVLAEIALFTPIDDESDAKNYRMVAKYIPQKELAELESLGFFEDSHWNSVDTLKRYYGGEDNENVTLKSVRSDFSGQIILHSGIANIKNLPPLVDTLVPKEQEGCAATPLGADEHGQRVLRSSAAKRKGSLVVSSKHQRQSKIGKHIISSSANQTTVKTKDPKGPSTRSAPDVAKLRIDGFCAATSCSEGTKAPLFRRNNWHSAQKVGGSSGKKLNIEPLTNAAIFKGCAATNLLRIFIREKLVEEADLPWTFEREVNSALRANLFPPIFRINAPLFVPSGRQLIRTNTWRNRKNNFTRIWDSRDNKFSLQRDIQMPIRPKGPLIVPTRRPPGLVGEFEHEATISWFQLARSVATRTGVSKKRRGRSNSFSNIQQVPETHLFYEVQDLLLQAIILKLKIIHTSLRHLNINWRLDKSSLNLSLMNLIKLSEALETILKANKIKNTSINAPIDSGAGDAGKRSEQLQKYYLLNFDVNSSATFFNDSRSPHIEQIKIMEQTLVRLPIVPSPRAQSAAQNPSIRSFATLGALGAPEGSFVHSTPTGQATSSSIKTLELDKEVNPDGNIYTSIFSNQELDTFYYIFPELKSKAWSKNWARGIKILEELARPEMVLEEFFIDEVIEMQNLVSLVGEEQDREKLEQTQTRLDKIQKKVGKFKNSLLKLREINKTIFEKMKALLRHSSLREESYCSEGTIGNPVVSPNSNKFKNSLDPSVSEGFSSSSGGPCFGKTATSSRGNTWNQEGCAATPQGADEHRQGAKRALEEKWVLRKFKIEYNKINEKTRRFEETLRYIDANWRETLGPNPVGILAPTASRNTGVNLPVVPKEQQLKPDAKRSSYARIPVGQPEGANELKPRDSEKHCKKQRVPLVGVALVHTHRRPRELLRNPLGQPKGADEYRQEGIESSGVAQNTGSAPGSGLISFNVGESYFSIFTNRLKSFIRESRQVREEYIVYGTINCLREACTGGSYEEIIYELDKYFLTHYGDYLWNYIAAREGSTDQLGEELKQGAKRALESTGSVPGSGLISFNVGESLKEAILLDPYWPKFKIKLNKKLLLDYKDWKNFIVTNPIHDSFGFSSYAPTNSGASTGPPQGEANVLIGANSAHLGLNFSLDTPDSTSNPFWVLSALWYDFSNATRVYESRQENQQTLLNVPISVSTLLSLSALNSSVSSNWRERPLSCLSSRLLSRSQVFKQLIRTNTGAEFRRARSAIERKNNTKSKVLPSGAFEKGDLFIKLMEYSLPVKIITQIPSGLLTMQANQGILSRSKNCASVEIGDYLYEGWEFESGRSSKITGQVIKVTQKQITVRLGTPYNYLSGHREFPFSANYARSKENFTDRGHILYQSPDSSKMKTQDIVQGLPKVEQLLEVRETKESLPIRNHVNVRLTKVFWLFRQCYPVKVAAQKSLTILAQFLVDEVQHIYRSQGVDVADKHLEIIIRSMSSRVEVDQPGYSPFSPGELLEIHSMDRFLKYEDFTYVPIILGMTKVGLTTQGFLSSTSFQQSKQQLIIAAVTQKVEFLQGFKARIMLGRKLPI